MNNGKLLDKARRLKDNQMTIKIQRTERGFAFGDFSDINGDVCSIQKSSLATDDAIWLGVNNANPKILKYGEGWVPCELPDGVLLTTRMHLDREGAAALIEKLQIFVDTGELEEIPDAL